jgi:lipid-binding SYLF domain-containing protein
VGFLGLLMIAAPAMAEPEMAKLEEKLQAAKAAYQELLATPDRSVPGALLENCRAIAVIPSAIKGALGYGARYGQGVISARDADGKWSPPSFIKLTGGSVGLQIGAEKSEVVLFFMTDKSVRSLLDSKFTLGGKVSVAAGPAGRSAEASTDLKLDAEIYSYAKSKGLFAGISLEGARLAADRSANQVFYGAAVDPKTLLLDHRSPRLPDAAKDFIATLP